MSKIKEAFLKVKKDIKSIEDTINKNYSFIKDLNDNNKDLKKSVEKLTKELLKRDEQIKELNLELNKNKGLKERVDEIENDAAETIAKLSKENIILNKRVDKMSNNSKEDGFFSKMIKSLSDE